MNKKAIKKYAIWARREMISRVKQRASFYNITTDNLIEEDLSSVNGRLLSVTEKKQRSALIKQIKLNGYEQVIEEIAYTWFNRFSALRFMEINGYLPSHIRVFTNEENSFKPQILTEAINLELNGLDLEKVYELKNANDDETLYKYLIITQCNALSDLLPGIFQQISDYSELLFPDNLLREGSVIEQMITQIPEEDWKDQVQIIGWLYQYYNTEPKDEVFTNLKKKIKISKESLPAATQLFTPDWIVHYMVENSLGRLWLDVHTDEKLKSKWKYYVNEADQDCTTERKLALVREEYLSLKPKDIRVIDPCQGSGHILCTVFDILMDIYESCGYSSRDAVANIIEKNLWGLDIDERATQLAYFSIMMKARQYDRRFFKRGLQPHIYSIKESNHLESNMLAYFIDGRPELRDSVNLLIEDLNDAKEYGAILNIRQINFDILFDRFEEIRNDSNIYGQIALTDFLPLVYTAESLVQKYDIVITNPPYMGSSGMSPKLSEFIKKWYPDSKSDLCTVFIEKCQSMIRKNGYQAMITQQAWMFLTSFKKLRIKLGSMDLINMLHLGSHAFEEIGGEVVQTTSFIFRNTNIENYKGTYCRLIEPTSQQEKEALFLSGSNRYITAQSEFKKIPGNPIAYWLSNSVFTAFNKFPPLKLLTDVKNGMSTTNNNRFVRWWFECNYDNIGIGYKNADEAKKSSKKWFPYNKGGEYRKYYGNIGLVVNWKNDGEEIKKATRGATGGRIVSQDYYFRRSISWSKVTAGPFVLRMYPAGFLFDVAGPGIFADYSTQLYILGLMNSKVKKKLLDELYPTMNYEMGQVGSTPIFMNEECKLKCNPIVEECIAISRTDWNSYETSWDFLKHPLVPLAQDKKEQEISQFYEARMKNFGKISWHYNNWLRESQNRFIQLKENEEKLNSLFIDIYNFNDELTPEVKDKEITIHYILDDKEDISDNLKGSSYLRTKRDEIISLISYAVGCMMGRYSLDTEGLSYAGGQWNISKYKTYIPDSDAIIPICDDEYFSDDLTGRFIEFIETAYGQVTLEENLQFIADVLGGKGTSREIIRKYFLSEFYSDHLKIYQKRPIYWLFDSGKKNGFKCLVYVHRYQPDTLARIRTDYVHEQQSRYRTSIEDLESRILNAKSSDRLKLMKKLKKLQEQEEEVRIYEEKIHHLADQMIQIDLDDGIKYNYSIFQDVLSKIK